VSTPADALQKAADALQALEREYADSAAALDGRRARHREAASQVETLSRRVKAADPDAKDFAKLSAERSTARDRAEALLAQVGSAENDHKALGGRVQQARIAHERATRVAAIARIEESSAHLSKRLRLFVAQFAPEVAAHFALVVAENRARAATNSGGSDPFTVWGEGSPDPATVGFWTMVEKAYTQALPAGEERLRYERSMQLANSIWGSVVSAVSGAR
jgi:hypothetical protein